MPFFFGTWFWAIGPYMRKEVTFWQQTFWLLLTPFGITALLFVLRWFVELAR